MKDSISGDDDLCTVASAVPSIAVLYWQIESRGHPAEKPLGVLVAHIDAAVAHGDAEVVVPECAMKGDSGLEDEEHGPGYAWQDIGVGSAGCLDGTHMFGGRLGCDMEPASGGLSSLRDGISS